MTPFEREACREMIASARYGGMFTPMSTKGTIMYPQVGGGANWGGGAFDPERNILVVPVAQVPFYVKLIPEEDVDKDLAKTPMAGNPMGPPGLIKGTKYGLQQTIADTLGIGGIMRGLRTVPVLVEIAKDIIEQCPKAWMLQYVNPMAINCLALSDFVPELQYVGLCHSVQGTAADLARDINEDLSKIQYECSGINHMSFFTKFEKKLDNGLTEDLYPKIFKAGEEGNFGTNWDGCSNHVRYEVLKRLGYFVTESSEHFAEYTPWFIKNHQKELISKFDIPVNEYIRRCKKQIQEWEIQEKELISKPQKEYNKSVEYASRIILSMVTGNQDTVYGNVLNKNFIPNLPNNCCVEVPCIVQKNDLTPQSVPPLPMHLANLIQTNINVQQLTVEALKTLKKESIYHAAMLDPHTAGELNLDQIWKMVDELLDAHGSMLPVFK